VPVAGSAEPVKGPVVAGTASKSPASRSLTDA
jgi:hypothetical protein